MKLTNLQIKTLANRAYKEILNSFEYKERKESLQEKVDNAWEEYKKSAVYKDIERILDKPYINNVCVLESDIAKSLKDFNEQDKFWYVDVTKQNHEGVARNVFNKMYKPKDIFVSDIEESIILNSITVEDGTTVEDLIQNILDHFLY